MQTLFHDPGFPYTTMPSIQQDGIWCEKRNVKSHILSENRPALFLDRDGVIVKEVNYLQNPNDVELIPGAAETIIAANQQNIPVIIITNQAGIAYGYFGWQDFQAVQDKMHEQLKAKGSYVDAVYACPFHQKGDTPWGGHPDHEARKPNAGMLLRASTMFSINMEKSWIVGDRASDLEAGKKAGLAGGLHVLTGHGSRAGEVTLARQLSSPTYRIQDAESIKAAQNLPLFVS
ncbi:D-glycero-alpha-D-manno-heptose-1,7-bisphosphate 7-phosphatase [Kiloniella litopenaei]|uniref:D-glycero-alpha-D-manno-heptose-1,7-bisphosphate 7-phosphatase n=1 Tax=Kiloniella litopenaei TaxID=1549748 RepID=UPI00069776E4|nr:HAD family hydrolase [Kiloniella litopenaei]